MEIKLVAVDLDDTLLNSRQEIEKACYEALHQAMKQGVMVVLATGRMMRSALFFAEQLGLTMPVIAYQGAWVKKREERGFLYYKNLPGPLAEEVMFFLEDIEVYYHVYSGDHLYVKEITGWVDFYRASGIEPVVKRELPSLVQEGEITEIMVAVEEEKKLEEIVKMLKERWKDDIHVSLLKNRYIEIMHKEATKREALQVICSHYGVKREEVMAIGDGYNDIPMLRWAGMGVAMGNAPLEVRKAADYVTLSHDECGVAYALRRWVLQG